MTKALALPVSTEPAPFVIPEAKAIEMVNRCTRQLATASSIPGVLRVITATDAAAEILKLVNASEETRLAALQLRLDAEARLGDLSAQIPKAKKGHLSVAERNQPTKKKILREYGVEPSRAAIAERLADIPRATVAAAVTSMSRPTLHGVLAHLNLRSNARNEFTPEKQARDLAFLADECICLLERLVEHKTLPHAGTVKEFRSRLTNLQGRRDG